MVVADMEAGLEHLTWAGGTLRHVDVLLVVVEATAKVLLTARRTNALAGQLGIAEVAFVANRVSDGDGSRLRAFARAEGRELLAAIPEDGAVQEADRRGVCLLDLAPDAPSVQAIEALADQLEDRFAG